MVFNLSLNSGDCPCAMNKAYGPNGMPQQLYCTNPSRRRKDGSKTPAGRGRRVSVSAAEDQ
jgi:hypothetical protein